MDPVRNPYTPNAGAEPEVIVGRDDQLASFDLLLRRLASGRTEQSMIITGLRGVGKTVLLGQFRSKALAAGWVVVEIEVSKHDDLQFRREFAARLRTALFELSPRARWGDTFRQAAAVLKSFSIGVDPSGTVVAGIDVAAAEGFGDHGDLSLDLSDVFVALGEAASSIGRGVVLLLDEVQFLGQGQLEALIGGLHRVVQRKLPITMVGAGLPQIAELAGDAKSYAERLFKFPAIGYLSAEDAAKALAGPAEAEGAVFEPAALDLALSITGGYPYFIQELGYAVWPLATGDRITRQDVLDAEDIYQSKLDSSFFRVRLDRTTEMQGAYLRAMASLGSAPQKASDVAEVLGRTSPQVGPTRAELIAMGLLYTPEHGYAGFTVPHFEQFMLRAMPELVVPPRRARRARGE
jgi:hypothetical protein